MISKNHGNQPIPQGMYIPAVKYGNVIYTSGMTPRRNGELIQAGQVKQSEELSTYRNAIELATQNALQAVMNCLSQNEQLDQILAVTVYVNAEEGFTTHTQLADYASKYLYELLGQKGVGSRAAIGVASLPGNAPVEIQIVAAVK